MPSGPGLALAHSMETQFGQVVEDMLVAERELDSLQGQVAAGTERVVELEAALETAEARASAVEQLKMDLQASRYEVTRLETKARTTESKVTKLRGEVAK